MMNILEDKQNDLVGICHTIEHLKEAFDTCTTKQARLGVLMLVKETISKSKVCESFGCSIYEIKTARTVLKQFGACGEEPKKKRQYSRLSLEKARHFIDFLLSTGLLQEVAYGTTNLKFDSGDKLNISNTVLNGIREQAVKEYIIHCKGIDYDPLGRTSFLNLLVKMKLHIRRKLAGLDTFVVDGIEAFEVSLKVCFRAQKKKLSCKFCLNRPCEGLYNRSTTKRKLRHWRNPSKNRKAT